MTFEVNDNARFKKISGGMCLGNGVDETKTRFIDCPTQLLCPEHQQCERSTRPSTPVKDHPFQEQCEYSAQPRKGESQMKTKDIHSKDDLYPDFLMKCLMKRCSNTSMDLWILK